MFKKISVFIAMIIAATASAIFASAATFDFSSDSQDFNIGDELVADLRIDSQGVSINAAQGTIRFSPDVLEAQSADRSASVFNFWLQEPTIDNSRGTISFTAGSTSGFSGAALEVLKINFRVKGTGQSSISLSDGAVTASDGSGTNVLVGTRGIDIESSEESLSGTQVTVSPAPVPPVTQITRPVVPATGLPSRPEVIVEAYPDSEAWYGFSLPFLVRWPLPDDILAVATQIDRSPNSEPARSEGLFNNKAFPALGDGIWYLHIQFRNNIGWGPVAHYRIAVDTIPPVPFDISFSSGPSSTDPSPRVSYESADSLSGLIGYSVQIDRGDVQSVEESSLMIPLQSPGKHSIRIVARDRAGNSTERTTELDVLPIESPTIDFFTRSVFVGEGGFEARGKSMPDYSVLVSLNDSNNVQALSSVVQVGADGEWSVRFDEPLKRGRYTFIVVAKDSRGALSLPIASETITASARPILVLGGLNITPEVFFIAIIIALIGAFAFGWFARKSSKEQRMRRIVIAKRDIVNVFNELEENLSVLTESMKKEGEDRKHEMQYRIGKIGENIAKTKKYIVKGVEEIETKKK
ncbi:MAG: cohesin domain-containing protein [Candidatus Colwellbacteria bacterium]|nr:cohesin domain-containing protein [Candidatus Colwellbacteria bacterium]